MIGNMSSGPEVLAPETIQLAYSMSRCMVSLGISGSVT